MAICNSILLTEKHPFSISKVPFQKPEMSWQRANKWQTQKKQVITQFLFIILKLGFMRLIVCIWILTLFHIFFQNFCQVHFSNKSEISHIAVNHIPICIQADKGQARPAIKALTALG